MSTDGPLRPAVRIPAPVAIPLRPRGVPVQKCPIGGSLSFCCLSPTLLATEVHWESAGDRKGRDRPCSGPATCPFCARGQSAKWLAWVGALVLPIRKIRLIPFTRYTWDHSPALRSVYARLRGQGIRLDRQGSGPQAPVLALPVPLPIDVTCPPEPHLESALGALWGMTLAEVDAWAASRRAGSLLVPPDPPIEEESF